MLAQLCARDADGRRVSNCACASVGARPDISHSVGAPFRRREINHGYPESQNETVTMGLRADCVALFTTAKNIPR